MARPENTASPRALARTEQETQAGPSDSDGPRTLKVRGPSRARAGGSGLPEPPPPRSGAGGGVRRIVTMARPENAASPRALARTEQETQAGPSDSDGPRTLKVRGPSRARSGGIGLPDLLPLAGSQLVDQAV